MGTTLRERLAELPPERRAKVDVRAAELIREEMTLAELRKAARETQDEMARRLKVKQASISRLERRSDMYLSTLRGYVEAMGGRLDLVAHLPDQPPVHLTGLVDIGQSGTSDVSASRKRTRREGGGKPRNAAA